MEILSVIWALLNIALVVGLLRFWLQSFSLIAVKYGRWMTAAGFLLTLSMCVRPAGDNLLLYQPTAQTQADSVTLAAFESTGPQTVTLLDWPLTTIGGYWTITKPPGGVPLLTFRTSQTGLSGYLRWKPLTGTTGYMPDKHLHYELDGVLTWYLLGIPLYQQGQHFSGDMPLQPEPHRPGV